MIDLIALKDFLVLCQTKSFSKAADRCCVSVSGLSRRIQGLEQWLGAPVFDRRKQSIELTLAGQRLQAVATEVVYALEGLRRSVGAEAEKRELQVRFSAPHVMSAVFFPEWMPRMHGEFKAAKISVHSDPLPECFQMLDDGSTDFVVALLDSTGGVAAQLGECSLAGYLTLDLGPERLLPVSAPGASSAPGRGLPPQYRLDGGLGGPPVSFLGYAPECHLGWGLQPLLGGLTHLQLEQRHSSTLSDGLRLMALSGLGVAWLPETVIRHDMEAGRLVRAGDASFDVPLRLTLLRRPDGMTDLAERLWRYLGSVAEQPSAAPPRPLAASQVPVVDRVPAPA